MFKANLLAVSVLVTDRAILMCKCIACFVCVGYLGVNAQDKWTQKEFILGTFWDPPLDSKMQSIEKDTKSFMEAKRAHFNLLTGMQGDGMIDHSFSGMEWALTVAHQVGLKYLVSDGRMHDKFDEVFEIESAKRVVRHYKKLPSDLRSTMLGYNLGDEPRYFQSHRSFINSWENFIESEDPQMLPYFNLVSSYAADLNWGGLKGGNYDGILDANEKVAYEKYLQAYVDGIHPRVISYDHFPFLSGNRIRRDYFYNLGIIRKISNGRPFWTYPMTVDHLDYVKPSLSQLRFMYFSPLAYGAKGLIVFTYWPPIIDGYRTALFDREGNKTERFAWVLHFNSFIERVIAPVVMRIPHVGVYHATAYPDNQVYLNEFRGDSSIVSSGTIGESVLIGIFKNKRERYLLVVNKNLFAVRDLVVELKGFVQSVFFAPRVVSFAEHSTIVYERVGTVRDERKRTSSFRIRELEGGEGLLVKLGK